MNRSLHYLVFALLLNALAYSASSAEEEHNELMRQSVSPYLQQHADNPIRWLPYSEAHLAGAEAANRLIFLSIGYATCHWCHVMNRESFQNEDVAAVLNESYTAIKMDREQYPDADQYYNDLLVQAGGTAGWPLNGILLPDGTPVWLGNYLSKQKLLTFLQAFAQHYKERSASLESQAAIYRALIQGQSKAPVVDTEHLATDDDLTAFGEALLAKQDPVYGGVLGAQKFPNPDNVARLWFLHDKTSDPRFKEAAQRHLDGMLQGNLYDPLYGGFFRYATTRDWREPHFEKPLYTQAQMLGIYVDAYKRTGIQRYLDVADDLVKFMDEHLRDGPDEYFSSGIDSEFLGIDGGRYLLPEAVAAEICNKDRCSFQVQGTGGLALLQVTNFDEGELAKLRDRHRELVTDREVRPFRDEKKISGWNAMALIARWSYNSIAHHLDSDKRGDQSNDVELAHKLLEDAIADGMLVRILGDAGLGEATDGDNISFKRLKSITYQHYDRGSDAEENLLTTVIQKEGAVASAKGIVFSVHQPQVGWIPTDIN